MSDPAVWRIASCILAVTTLWAGAEAMRPARPNAATPGALRLALASNRPASGWAGNEVESVLVELDTATSTVADPRVVSALARRLGRLRSERAVPVLSRLASSPSREVALAAIRSLAAIDGRRAVDVLIALARGDVLHRRDAAIDALGAVSDRRAADMLVRIARDPRTRESIRARAISAIASSPNDDAIGRIPELCRERGPHLVLESATRALRTNPSPVVERVLFELSIGANPEVVAQVDVELALRRGDYDALIGMVAGSHDVRRSYAAQALIDVGAVRSLPQLRRLSRSARGETRSLALNVIVRLGGTRERGFLIELLEGQSLDSSVIAAIALTDDELLIAKLVERLRALPAELRTQLVFQLGTSRHPAVIGMLTDLARSGIALERTCALCMLLDMGHRGALASIESTLQRGSTRERGWALSCLSNAASPEAAAIVERQLRQARGAERAELLRVLARLEPRTPGLVRELEREIRERNDTDAQSIAALAGLGTPESEAALARLARTLDAQRLGVLAAGLSHSHDLVDALIARVRSDRSIRPNERSALIGGLVRTGSPAARDLAYGEIEDLRRSDGSVPGGVHDLLTGIRSAGGAIRTAALSLTDASNPNVRLAVVNALGGEVPVDDLIRLSADDDEGVRDSAIAALAEQGSPGAREALTAMTRRDDDSTRLSLLRRADALPGDLAESVVLDALASDDTEMAQTAIRAAGSVRGDATSAALLDRLRDQRAPAFLRAAAAAVLSTRGGDAAREARELAATLPDCPDGCNDPTPVIHIGSIGVGHPPH